MSEPPSDEDLMLAYAAGDMDAFQTLYARHHDPLYRFIARGISPGTADECFQDVWSRVVAARSRYRPEARFSTWLYQIAQPADRPVPPRPPAGVAGRSGFPAAIA